MANLYNTAHKTSTKKSRDGWDRTFGNKAKEREGIRQHCDSIMQTLFNALGIEFMEGQWQQGQEDQTNSTQTTEKD